MADWKKELSESELETIAGGEVVSSPVSLTQEGLPVSELVPLTGPIPGV